MALETSNTYKCHSCYEYFDIMSRKRIRCECGNSVCTECIEKDIPCYFCGKVHKVEVDQDECYNNEYTIFTQIKSILIDSVAKEYRLLTANDEWRNSEWKHIHTMDTCNIDNIGHTLISSLCKTCNIHTDLNIVTDEYEIMGQTTTIITTCLDDETKMFKHNLGRTPWLSEYIMFIDIAPHAFYITLFPNFSEDFYKSSAINEPTSCFPIFPSQTLCWNQPEKKYNLHTTEKINEINSYTMRWSPDIDLDVERFSRFVRSIIA